MRQSLPRTTGHTSTISTPTCTTPRPWAAMAKSAGMKYFCITAKHHEGFCLWDTKYTDYKATNTPCGQDLLTPMVNAFRAEGLKVGLYYSLIDWHHREFPVDRHHPQSDEDAFREANAGRDVRMYAKYMRNQVTELLTQFGKIDYLFFDYSYPRQRRQGPRRLGEREAAKGLSRAPARDAHQRPP